MKCNRNRLHFQS